MTNTNKEKLMANYYAISRTNYVKCSDKEGLIKSIKPFGLKAIFRKIDNEDIVVFEGNDDSGCWPSWTETTLAKCKKESLTKWFENAKHLGWFLPKADKVKINNCEILSEFSWEEIVMPFIAINEVLIVILVGAEKLRYINGRSEAYVRVDDNNDYESVLTTTVDLNSIYVNACHEFEIDIDKISRAEY